MSPGLRAGGVLRLTCLTGFLFAPGPGLAHEVRPGYLELKERSPHRFEVTWKQPLRGNRRLPIDPELPEVCRPQGQKTVSSTAGLLMESWSVDCGEAGLTGQTVAIAGLERTLVDVLVRVSFADGETLSHLLRPQAPSFVVNESQPPAPVAYLRLGIEHLLFGFDHILFVVGLMFLVHKPLELFKVITAFTVAHSITLALSTLHVVRLSQAPVEAVIALSLLFLATELAKGPAVPAGTAQASWGRTSPWAFAFGFGLLHGFGFAGALADIGLPKEAAAPALFLFNVGVEIGQLLIVALILGGLWLARSRRIVLPRWLGQVPIYAMGGLSAYWLVERVGRML